MKYNFISFLVMLFVFGCSKTEKKVEVTNQTYTIKASNFSVENFSLIIQTSLEKEKTVAIPRNSEKDINFLAAAGEYVKFTVTNNAFCNYRVLDSKGVTIALYESLPSSTANIVELDFIAFPTEDTEKNFIKYKTGLAKKAGENLIGRPYLLQERYYLENGLKTVNLIDQEACTYNDEYRFLPVRGESGNFNPQRLIFTTTIDKSKSSCSYGPGQLIPTNNISVLSNGNNKIAFPIWDRLAIDGPPSNMIYRELHIDFINSTGTLSLSREMGNNKKEVFIYKPK